VIDDIAPGPEEWPRWQSDGSRLDHTPGPERSLSDKAAANPDGFGWGTVALVAVIVVAVIVGAALLWLALAKGIGPAVGPA
jgi:hypothetical protein